MLMMMHCRTLGGFSKHVFDTTSCMKQVGDSFSRVTMGQKDGHLVSDCMQFISSMQSVAFSMLSVAFSMH